MKKLLLPLAILVISVTAFSQQNCNKPERFIYQENSLEITCYFARIGDTYSMNLDVVSTKDSIIFKKGEKVILDLVDVSEIELVFIRSGYIELEDWQLQILDKLRIERIRVYGDDSYQDWIVDNPSIAINQLNCLY